MLPASALSNAAYGLRELLVSEIDDFTDFSRILIGPPSENFETLKSRQHTSLNLFFYEVKHDAYPTDVVSDNPFYVRIRCLITALGSKTNGPPRDISSGENELRVIGEVMRVFHQNPFLELKDAGGEPIAQLQVVPYTIDLDNLNHIWSTQNDASYRISVVYELGLAPVPAQRAQDVAPRVQDPRLVVVPEGAEIPAKEDILSLVPQVDYLEVDVGQDKWVPHICYVKDVGGTPSLHYVMNISGNLNTELDILMAGKDQGQLTFYWDIWIKQDDHSVVGWQEKMPDTVAPQQKLINDSSPSPSNPFYPGRIDPENIDARRIVKVALPDGIKDSNVASWQAVLYAVHEWENPMLQGSVLNPITEIRSNTLMFYGGQP